MKGFIKTHPYVLIFLLWNSLCLGFSATYFYELYLHNEYYEEPPGFPSKLLAAPIIASFTGKGEGWTEKRFSAGLIEAIRLTHNHTWIELIAAFGKERVRFNHQGVLGEKSRMGWDDFLIDFGYNFLDESGKKQLLMHWLIGVPVRKKVTSAEIEGPLWGTRSYATGPVIEAAYDLIRSKEEDLFIGLLGRFLHRYKRHYEPILPLGAFFRPGDALDILAITHYRYYGQNIEVGYVYTRYNAIANEVAGIIERLPSERYNSFYIDYSYYYEEKALSFEINITKTFGKPYDGITVYWLIGWYF